MPISFSSSQTVEIAIAEQPIPIQHYLRQPHRLVYALVDPSRIEHLGNDSFRLMMRPLSFMMLSIQPTVDMRVWSDAKGILRIESIRSEIRGIEYINQRFALKLVGRLMPETVAGKTYLRGRADLSVTVEPPPALMFTPKPILEATGNGLLHSVLLSVKQRLVHQLVADYCKWVAAQRCEASSESSMLIPVQPNSLI